MPDVPIIPEPEHDEEFAEKLVLLRNRIDDAARTTLTGQTGGSMRRALLFITVAVSLVLNLPALGIIALGILMLTDQVVELS